MLVEVIHPSHRAIGHEHTLADSTRFGTGFAHHDLRVRIRDDFVEPLRRPEGDHLLIRALQRDRYRVMIDFLH